MRGRGARHLLLHKQSTRIPRRWQGEWTHLNETQTAPKMVDISLKTPSLRTAHAMSVIVFPEEVFQRLVATRKEDGNEWRSAKGPVFTTAIIAGTMAAKRTWELIPFCHLLPLERCEVTIKADTSTANALRIDCQVAANYHTGVEMEALVGATHAALCIYDMCKALSHNIVIQETRLLSKTGGKTDIQMKM